MPLFYITIPICFLIVQLCLEFLLPMQLRAQMHIEGGPHETMQVLVLLGAFIVALMGCFKAVSNGKGGMGGWFLLAAICCLYVGGEEVSWGQHIFEWTTPEFWSAVNDQNETNLHNTSSWLDQKPRLILEIGIIIGGLIIPLLRKYKPALLIERFEPIYPATKLWVIALMAVLVKVIDDIGAGIGYVFLERGSEVQELYFYYFVLLYLIDLKRHRV